MPGSSSAAQVDPLAGFSLGVALLFPVVLVLVAAVGWLAGCAVYVLLLILAAALALGVIALLRIRRSGGELTGKQRAVQGMALSTLGIVLASFYFFLLLPAWHSLGCYLNLEGMPLVFHMYAGDYGALPPADSWCDSLSEYVHSEEYFVCPARPDLQSGYAMNRALGSMRLEDIQTALHLTVLVFESDAGWNANGGPELLPSKPRHYVVGRRFDTYGYAGGLMNSATPPMARHERAPVIDGTAGIFWDPTAMAKAGSHLLTNE